MNAPQLQREWLSKHVVQSDLFHQPTLPEWLDVIRKTAARKIVELPVLDRKHELWRYTNLENLLSQNFNVADKVEVRSTLVSRQEFTRYEIDGLESDKIVLVNGKYSSQLSSLGILQQGVTITALSEALAENNDILTSWFGTVANPLDNIFTALNTAMIQSGVFIHISEEVRVKRPIEVIYLSAPTPENYAIKDGANPPLMLQSRNLIVLENSAEATIIERFVGGDSQCYFNNQLSELIINNNSRLIHYRVQDESRDAFHLSNIYLSQLKNSWYRCVNLGLAGKWNRTEFHGTFTQPGSTCELYGLSVVSDSQLMDMHLQLNHESQLCTSREHFKSIVFGRGKAVFDGQVRVEKQAQFTDALMTSDNLLLNRNGEVDTKPQLEIYADNVKCSHGTTVGELDAEQLFYLRSRGIDETKARAMLCIGFAGNILEKIELYPLQIACVNWTESLFSRRLNGGAESD